MGDRHRGPLSLGREWDNRAERSTPLLDRPAPSIVVVGSCNIDLVSYASRIPGPGETILGERFAMGFGGKGANQAVMAARLGAKVAMVGALGTDVYRDMTLANFKAEGVDTTHVVAVVGSSGVAPIWVEPDGTNRIIVVPGANFEIDSAHVAAAVRSMAAVDVVVGQLEIPQAATFAAFQAARARGALTILNPAPAAAVEPGLLEVTDWLIPNEHELEALGPAGLAEADAMLGLARSVGAGLVVTLGERGAEVVSGGNVTRLAAPVVDANDTTGAGDAFVGAFAVGLSLGMDAISAARLGIACASDSVERAGTQASFPDRRRALELQAAIEAGGA